MSLHHSKRFLDDLFLDDFYLCFSKMASEFIACQCRHETRIHSLSMSPWDIIWNIFLLCVDCLCDCWSYTYKVLQRCVFPYVEVLKGSCRFRKYVPGECTRRHAQVTRAQISQITVWQDILFDLQLGTHVVELSPKVWQHFHQTRVPEATNILAKISNYFDDRLPLNILNINIFCRIFNKNIEKRLLLHRQSRSRMMFRNMVPGSLSIMDLLNKNASISTNFVQNLTKLQPKCAVFMIPDPVQTHFLRNRILLRLKSIIMRLLGLH